MNGKSVVLLARQRSGRVIPEESSCQACESSVFFAAIRRFDIPILSRPNITCSCFRPLFDDQAHAQLPCSCQMRRFENLPNSLSDRSVDTMPPPLL